MTQSVPRILCQPGRNIGCGSCCGMYNTRESSPHQIQARLLERTRAFEQHVDIHDVPSLQAFRLQWEPAPEDKLLSDLPSCPFLGYLDADAPGGRVGCMIHPTRYDGLDQRDCGVYDRFICEDYLCAAHSLLSLREKRLILDAVEDSFLYGLVITDVRFVRALFELTAQRNGMAPPERVLQRPQALEHARAYFELKRDWPYRGIDGIFGSVVPGQGLETSRRAPPHEQVRASSGQDVKAHALDAVLICLGTQVSTLEELRHARALVDAALERFGDAVEL